MAICPNCSTDCPDNQAYCDNCGTQLHNVQQPLHSQQQYSESNTYSDNPNSENPYQANRFSANAYNTDSAASMNLPVKKYTFIEALKQFFKNYANFSGRATRSEYWYVFLFNCMITIPLDQLSTYFYGEEMLNPIFFISSLFSLVTIIPSISLAVRRMHDIGKSGITLLWSLLLFIGAVILFIFTIRESDGDNEYGPRKVEGMVDTD